MSDTLPSTHTAGDSTDWLLEAGDYLPGLGWSAQLVLIGPARISVECEIANAAQFGVQLTSATTAAWQPGDYTARVLYTKAGERHSRELTGLRILPDPASSASTARVFLTAAEAHLADLEAAYRDHMASGNAVVAEYRIGTRMTRFKDTADLIKAIDRARLDVEREKAAASLAAGGSARRRFVVRM